MILLPQKKTQKKLRDSLNQLYTHLDSAGGSGDVSFEFVEYTYVVTCFNSSASRNLKHFGNPKNEINKVCTLCDLCNIIRSYDPCRRIKLLFL